MTELFLSYARDDRPVVEALVADLRASGYAPYFDEELAGGQQWWAELLSRIESARAFLPVLAPGYLDSSPCQLEAAYAAALGKPFLPVSVQQVPPQLCPEAISSAQWVDYDHEDPHSILAVIRAINGLEPTPPLPEPMPPRPVVPISYMNELQTEIGSQAEIARSRQIVIIADLKGRLATTDRQAAILLLRRIRERADIGYQAAVDIDETLARVSVETTPLLADVSVDADDPPVPAPVEEPVTAPVEEPVPAPVEEPVATHVAAPPEPPADVPAAVPPERAIAPWVTVVGRLAAVSMLAVLPITVLAFREEFSTDGWNLFAVLSPFEAVLAGVAVWLLVGALGRGQLSTATGAGALTAIGALSLVGSVGLVKFTSQRVDGVAVVLSLLALLGAAATLAVAVSCIRASSGTATPGRIDPIALILGLAGVGLAVVAVLQHYDGNSSLASELGEGGVSAEFFFEPALAIVLMLVGLGALASWPRFGIGVLVAAGTQIAVHYLGVLLAAHFAVGEEGLTGPAWVIGLFAGVSAAAAGFYAHGAGRSNP
jgi:hypothetical protein